MVEQGTIEKLTIIEPDPGELLESLKGLEGVAVEATTSEEALPRLPAADLYLIDGDHNYYTVSRETETILGRAELEARPAVLCYHDVCWPCDRRDFYYAPERIPEEFRRPHSFDLGVTLDVDELIVGGFRSLGHYAIAEKRGGPRNGVLTAVEEGLAKHPGWELFIVPAVMGLGVVVQRSNPDFARIAERLAPYTRNFLIERLERNRLELYLKVLALQDDLDGLRNGALAFDAGASHAPSPEGGSKPRRRPEA